MKRETVFAALVLFISCVAHAQELDPATRWATIAFSEYRVSPDIVYKTTGGMDLKLDVITAGNSSDVRPTVIFIHGGGWVGHSKESHMLFPLPYLARGMNVVNVEYRLASESLAPAAVEDCRCALRWVYRNATEYGFDTAKLVMAGESAGGHLSLMTGMLDASAGFDNDCPADEPPGNPPLKVAVIVNYCGIADVVHLLEGPRRQHFAVSWLGSQPNRMDLARRLSPISHVRRGLPPVITLHGDADDVVPYEDSVKLHEALGKAGVPNQLVTLPGTKHWNWPRKEYLKAQQAVFKFLEQHGVLSH